MMNKKKILRGIHSLTVFCLCALIFASIFSKAGVEIFFFAALFFWLLGKVCILQFPLKLTHFFSPNPLNIPLAVYFGINMISTFNSVYFQLSFFSLFTKVLENLLIYFIAADTLATGRYMKWLVGMLIFAVSMLVLDAFFQYAVGFDLFRHFIMNDDNRVKAAFSNANDMAGWLILSAPVVWIVAFVHKTKNILLKWYLMLLSAASLFCLVLSYSRGALLGAFVSSVIICAYYRKKAFKFCMFLLVVTCGVVLSPLHDKIFLNIFAGQGSVSVLARLDLWKRSLHMIADYPLLGSGLNTYVLMIGRYSEDFYSGASYPHNSFLHMATEIGVIGLAAFIYVLFKFFRTAGMFLSRAHPVTKGAHIGLALCSGIAAFLIQSFFDTNLTALQLVVPFWLMMGAVMSEV